MPMMPGLTMKPTMGQPKEFAAHELPGGSANSVYFPAKFHRAGDVWDGEMGMLRKVSEGVAKFMFGMGFAAAAFWYLPHSLPFILVPAVIAFWAGMGLAKAKMYWFIHRYLDRPTRCLVPGAPGPV